MADIAQIKVGNTTYNIHDASARTDVIKVKFYSWVGSIPAISAGGISDWTTSAHKRLEIRLPIPVISNFIAVNYSGLRWTPNGYKALITQSYLTEQWYASLSKQYLYLQWITREPISANSSQQIDASVIYISNNYNHPDYSNYVGEAAGSFEWTWKGDQTNDYPWKTGTS